MKNKNNIIWLAGLIDGEGCIYAKLGKTSKAVSSHIQIHCASKIMIDEVEQIYQEEGIIYKREKPGWGVRSTRPTHRITIWRKGEVVHLLNLITPYLRVKKAEANRVLTYYNTISNNSIKPTLQEKINYVEELKRLKRV